MRLNDEITARNVRVTGADGEQIGVVSLDEAKQLAYGANLDLVEISPNADPPVCRVMDYGKYQFDHCYGFTVTHSYHYQSNLFVFLFVALFSRTYPIPPAPSHGTNTNKRLIFMQLPTRPMNKGTFILLWAT